LRYFQEALQAHERAGGTYFREELVEGLGAVAAVQGDYVRAQYYYEQALRFCRERGGASDVAHALIQLGDLARKQGGYAAARRDLAEALALHEGVGETRGLAVAYHRLGLLAQSENDLGVAEQHYHTSLQLFTALAMPFGQAQAWQGLSQIAQAVGDHARAGDHLQTALRLTLELDAQPLILDLLVSLADLWLVTRHTVDACVLLLLVDQQATVTYETRTKAHALLAHQREVAPHRVAQAQQQIDGKPTVTEILTLVHLTS